VRPAKLGVANNRAHIKGTTLATQISAVAEGSRAIRLTCQGSKTKFHWNEPQERRLICRASSK